MRISYEAEIPETDQYSPFDQLASYKEELPPKDEPVMLYYRSSLTRTDVTERLAEMGYTRVLQLNGGMNGCRATGRSAA